MIDISADELNMVLEILNKFVPGYEVRVFGSRYKGKVKTYSDLDLAIVGKDIIDWEILENLKEAFQESDLPFRVDILDWNNIEDDFQKVIIKNGFEIIKLILAK